MILDSEDQREKMIAVITSVRIEGTLAEVDHISAGLRQLLRSVKEATLHSEEGKEQ